MAGNPISIDEIKAMINSNFIVVFSKTYCPYCKKAKALLTSLDLEFAVYELDTMSNGAAIQATLATVSNVNSVPQIFVGGEFVGGCDKVHLLHDNGKLVPFVKEKKMLWDQKLLA